MEIYVSNYCDQPPAKLCSVIVIEMFSHYYVLIMEMKDFKLKLWYSVTLIVMTLNVSRGATESAFADRAFHFVLILARTTKI